MQHTRMTLTFTTTLTQATCIKCDRITKRLLNSKVLGRHRFIGSILAYIALIDWYRCIGKLGNIDTSG